MAVEIERKFLIVKDKLPVLDNDIAIEKGYIPTKNGTTVRVRIAGENACLCIKSQPNNFSRNEYEFAIPINDAREMFEEICNSQPIVKLRYLIAHQDLRWEIDVFDGRNRGLIVAEVELLSEDQKVHLPEWVAKEVTRDKRYNNSYLALNPYSTWQVSTN